MMSDRCIAKIAFYFAVELGFFVVSNTMEYLSTIRCRFCPDDIIHISFVSEFTVTFNPGDFSKFVCRYLDLCQTVAVGFRFDEGLDILMSLVSLDQ